MHKIKPDMIHVHMEGIARLIRIKNGTPIIRTIHNITSVSNEYPKFDKLFAISKAARHGSDLPHCERRTIAK